MTMNTFYFDGRLMQTFIDDGNIAKLHVYALSLTDSSFVLQEKLEKRGDCDTIRIEKYGTFVDSHSGLRKLFIVVRNVSSESYYLLSSPKYSISGNNINQLSAVLQFEEEDSEAISKSLHVLDGPVLFWHCQRNIYVTSINVKTQTLKKHCFSLPEQVDNFNVISAVTCEDDIYVFIHCAYQYSHECESFSSSDSKILVWNLKLDYDGNWIKKELDPSDFLPVDYADLIKDCAVILKSASDKAISADSKIVLLLEGSYIIFLRNGVLEQCCLVKNTEDADSTYEWRLVSVFSDTKCVVWTSKSDISLIDIEKEEISQTWSDVSSATVGDFLRRGSPQLLLVFQDGSTRGEIGAWLLTDIAGFEMDSRDITDPTEEGDTDSGIANAVESLYSNLQSSLSDLCVREQYFINKIKFLHNTWQQLHRNNTLDPTPHRSVIPLVPMIPGREKPKRLREGGGDAPVGSLEVEVLWRSTVASHLVVGVGLHNNTNRTFSKCSLLLVPHSKGNISSGFSRWPPSLKEQTSELFSDRGYKKLKMAPDVSKFYCSNLNPEGKATVTVSTNLSKCDFQQDVKLWLLLLARETIPVSEAGECGAEEKSETRIMCCDLLSLSSEEYLQGKLAISPQLSMASMNNELDEGVVESSLTAVQKETKLSLTSRFTDLRGVWHLLQGGAGYTSTPGLHCLTHPSCTPLQHARISQPSILSRTSLHLSAWTRNTNQLLLLIKHLYSHLPDDLVIRQVSDLQSSPKMVLSSLGDELKTISMASRTLLDACSCNLTTGTGSSLAGVKHQEQVAELRQRFSEEQSLVQTLEEATIDINLLKAFQSQVKEAQKKTDMFFGCLV